MTLPEIVLHALSSSNVVIGDEVIPATVVYSPTTGNIVSIIRKDSFPSTSANDNSNSSDEDLPEYYDEELEALGVLPENHRDIGDLVLMPGLVDAHVHLNEVCLVYAAFLKREMYGFLLLLKCHVRSTPLSKNSLCAILRLCSDISVSGNYFLLTLFLAW